MGGIQLRMGIFSLFLAIMLPLIGAMTGILYRQNMKLAEDTAVEAMDKATEGVVAGVQGMLEPITRTVELSTTFGKAQRESLRRPEAWAPLLATLRQQKSLYSLYYGFAREGEFLQMIRLPPDLKAFGPRKAKPPESARYVVRTIDGSSGQTTDSFVYFGESGDIVKVERNLALDYDPRQRPWYQSAQGNDELANSGVYVFSGTGKPGLTLSQRVTTDDKELIGVFGADISMTALADLLGHQKVGAHSVVFIVDDSGRLIGYPDSSRNFTEENGTWNIASAKDFSDPVVAGAVRHFADGGDKRFDLTIGDTKYLISLSSLPPSFNTHWLIGVAVDEEDFAGPIRRASLRILLIGAVIVFLAGIGVVVGSRLLTRPISKIIAETNLIRELSLDEPVRIDTSVRELNQLAIALDSMKSALRSFGVYVPKELVRQIVASGSDTTLGGVRQPTTILFSDLAGFTKASEGLAPEEVLARLSDYFDVMAEAIHDHHGTIDKYIGDAIMALWNAPSADPDHQIHACDAMLACSKAGKALNVDFAKRGLPPFTTRLGLHTGTVVVGNVGSRKRMQYTALGSAVNLASRVEGINKKFGTELLVTGAVEEAVRGRFLFRPFGPVIASGTSIPIPLFELLGRAELDDPLVLARVEAWQTAFDAYRAGRWTEAVEGFQCFLGQWPDDGAAELFLAQCQSFVVAPPPEDFDGALHFDSK